jgi:hypothetical protein
MLSNLNMSNVFAHYQSRLATHNNLVSHFGKSDVLRYTDLALGISAPEGNYSASEYQLGPQILSVNPRDAVFRFANDLQALHSASHLPTTIYNANLQYLRIGVGSEMAMMLNPEKFWVGNVRTLYSHLLLKHNQNKSKADEELRLYRDPDGSRPSEMEYRIWRDIYLALEQSLKEISRQGAVEARKQNAAVGRQDYMWADAICSFLYEDHA